MLSISPESTDDYDPERIYAWTHGLGVSYGRLFSAPLTSELGDLVFRESKLFPLSGFPGSVTEIQSIALTQYHLLALCGGTLFAINRLDDNIVFQDIVVRKAFIKLLES